MSVRISRDRLGRRAASTATTRSRSRGGCSERGCDIVDVSTGQVSPDQQPAYGRSYQTPFADRIRHEVGHPDDRRRRDLQLRRRQHDHPRRPRRPLRARPPAPVRPALDAARRRRAGLRQERGGLFSIRPDRANRRADGATSVRKELERTFEPAPVPLVRPAGERRGGMRLGRSPPASRSSPRIWWSRCSGPYVRPFGDMVWSGGPGRAARRVRVLAGRGAGRADPAGPPRADRAGALRAGSSTTGSRRAASGCCSRATGGSSRSAPSGPTRRTWTLALASDPGGPAARAKPAGAAVAVPRIRVGAGQRVGVSARPLRRGPRAARQSSAWTSLRRCSGRPEADAVGAAGVRLESVESERPGRALRGVRVRVRGVPVGGCRRGPERVELCAR